MTSHTPRYWDKSFIDPSNCREGKPRQTGYTMIIDNGLGHLAFDDLLQTASTYIDMIKLGYGSAVLYPPALLHEKLSLAKRHAVTIYPGGTFFEIAYVQGKAAGYLEAIRNKGFTTVEISDGSIEIPRDERSRYIALARELGLQVITECGKKADGSSLVLDDVYETLMEDIESGAALLIIEGRESGRNVGIYDVEGQLDVCFLEKVSCTLKDFTSKLIWEAPRKEQQIQFIECFGSNVNLGNIAPQDVYSLESLRRGLRSDTFPFLLQEYI